MSDDNNRGERAEHLMERIYLTFTALAVVIALRGHEGATTGEALVTLLVTSVGTLLAVLVADVISAWLSTSGR